jgi:hypothetical protein
MNMNRSIIIYIQYESNITNNDYVQVLRKDNQTDSFNRILIQESLGSKSYKTILIIMTRFLLLK